MENGLPQQVAALGFRHLVDLALSDSSYVDQFIVYTRKQIQEALLTLKNSAKDVQFQGWPVELGPENRKHLF